MNVIEHLVKLADRLDAKGREDLANKVDQAIAQLKLSHCGSCEQDAKDPVRPECKCGLPGCAECNYDTHRNEPTTEELIEKLEREPFQPSVSDDPTDEEVAGLWEEDDK